MADNFGLKIGVEGEKDSKKALSDINQSFKVLGSEMTLVTSQFDKNDKSVEAITARNAVLNKEIDAQKGKIETLRSALDNAASSFGENDRRTQNWQVQLNKAEAELNGMERELSGNEKALAETGSEFQEGAKDADNILTMSSVTGMSTDSLQAYQYAAELVDTSLNTLTGSMAKNVRSMFSAQSGTGKMADAYKALGISVTDSNGNLRDSETVYWEAIDALGNVSNETERDALAMQLFDKSAQELNPLIEKGSAGIAALTDEAKRMGAVMSTGSLETLGKFDDSMQRLKSGGTAAKNVLGMVLLPQLQTLADSGVSLLGTFTSGLIEANGDWTKISAVIGTTVGSLVSMLMAQLPQIIQAGIQLLVSLIQALPEIITAIVAAIPQIINGLVTAIVGSIPQLIDAGVKLLIALVQNLPLIITAVVKAIPQNISAVTPKALSEKELAREFKNLSRKLALEL